MDEVLIVHLEALVSSTTLSPQLVFGGLVWGSSNAHGGVADDGGGVGWDQLDQMMECQVHLSAYGVCGSHVG